MRITRDILWKGIIQDFFPEFLSFFFSKYYDHFDLKKGYEFLNKELKQLFPEQKQDHRIADLLVKVFLKNGEEKWILIHIEVQGYKDETFAKRVFIYAYRSLDRFKVPIASLAILTDSDKRFRPSKYEYSCLSTQLVYEFETYKLIDHNPEEYHSTKNPFGIIMQTALMGLKRNWKDEELFNMKIHLFRTMLEKGYSKVQIRRITNFIKLYVHFHQKNLNRKFENEVFTITKNKSTMGIEEAIMNFAKETGYKEGIEEGVKEGKKLIIFQIFQKFPDQNDTELAALVNEPIEFIKTIRQEWKEKQT